MLPASNELNKGMLLAEKMNDASIDCVLALDTNLRIISWNKMCALLFHKERAEVLGKGLFDLFPTLDESGRIKEGITQALKGFKSFVALQTCCLGHSPSENHIIPIKDADGAVESVLIIRHDVAHRVKTEQELERLNDSLAQKNWELEERNNELLSFAHITSHDLKEPLRKIQLFSNMLMESDLDRFSPNGKSYFTRIQRAALKMETLTDDMLTFARINDIAEPETEVNLNHVLKFVENHFRQTIRDCAALINAQTLPAIRGHRTLLYVLFQNLIGNSLKFHLPEHNPSLFIRCGKSDGKELRHPEALGKEGYTWISIEDDGIGFDPQYKRQIFEMFQRLDTTNQYPGNGIGLAVCRKIAHIHRGFITADSIPGKGSTFTCYFPQADAVSA